jgi:hypothetical protein
MQRHPRSISDRRAAVRYKLRLPAIFRWIDGDEQTEGGFTTIVSLDGVIVVSSRRPPVGAEVRIELLLPSPDEMGCELHVQCVGKVTQAQGTNNYGSFAVQGLFDDEHLTRLISDVEAGVE